MKIGILYRRDPRHDLNVSIRLAVLTFENALHAGQSGHFPAEARFHPSELPEEKEIQGLSLLPDRRIRPGHIRITTCELLPEQSKMEAAA